MAKLTIAGPEELRARAGQELGATEWRVIEMSRIRGFADATDDHQWIHVDEERALRESPFKKPIAHGYLTLSLTAGAFFELIELQGFAMVVNYGSNKVRYPAPLHLGDRYRVAFKMGDVRDAGGGWFEAIFVATVEVEGQAKPSCVAECVYRFKTA